MTRCSSTEKGARPVTAPRRNAAKSCPPGSSAYVTATRRDENGGPRASRAAVSPGDQFFRMQSTPQAIADEGSVQIRGVPGGEFAGTNDAVTVFFIGRISRNVEQ